MSRILIVEDDPDIASLLRRGLAAAGYAADWAETAEAALAAAEAGGLDAAIIDMMLGEDSGAGIQREVYDGTDSRPSAEADAQRQGAEQSEEADQ